MELTLLNVGHCNFTSHKCNFISHNCNCFLQLVLYVTKW